jgi:hypothetical protein
MTKPDETKTAMTATEVKTMWSETLLEALYVALEKKAGDAKIREILEELKGKGYKKDYLIEKVTKKAGPNAADHLKRVYSGIAVSAKAGAGKKPNAGLVGKLKGIFK